MAFFLTFVSIGDASFAAIIAALASVVNGIMLLRAHRIQGEIKTEVVSLTSDTATREHQIAELRSLSLERMRHIVALERIIDRLEAVQIDLQERSQRVRKTDKFGTGTSADTSA